MATRFSIGAGKSSGTTDGVIAGRIQLDVLPLGSKGKLEEYLDNGIVVVAVVVKQVPPPVELDQNSISLHLWRGSR